ncbi:site-2 protease family protein [Clostridium frigidicarnis]|uniref:Stage IV sporulation protein FB n=1 Tax=Clostridium frigidicarnis TaxID=84698 RepID=A0A1I0YSL0_9CLOT|nr:site-2 protease family protein [Clostridium frigidicarnis]SFB16379.1 stage IV sporulation protein FB [Clostridium frigidicarnis]
MTKKKRLLISYIVILIMIGFQRAFLIAFIFVFLHELTHVLTARLLGVSDIKLKIIPMGTYIESNSFDYLDLKEDILISLSGPIFNLILGFIFWSINKYLSSEFVLWCALSNLALGLINLLPAFPLDGARIIRCILNKKIIYKRANNIVIKLSFFTGIVMIIFFIISYIYGVVNFSILLMAILILYISHKEKERVVYIIMGDIVKKKSKFLKKSYIENKSISVYYKKDLLYLMNIMDKNKNNIFTVLDDNMEFKEVIFEQEIVEALKVYGNISIEEYINIKY